MRTILSGVLAVFASLFLSFGDAESAPGTCTATTDGNVGAVTWTGTNCSDSATDGCGVLAGTAPDSDDSLSVGTHAVTFNTSCTFEHMNSVGNGAVILFKAGTTSTFNNADDFGSQYWARGDGWFIVEPGATVKNATSSNGVCGTADSGGHIVIEGRVLQETTIVSTNAAAPVDSTHINVTLLDPVPDAQAGDVMRFHTGPAMAMTFEISDPRPVAGAPNIVEIASTPTDAHHVWGIEGCTRDGTDKRKCVQSDGDNLVSSNDQYYLGKFMWDGASEFYPIVQIDEGGANTDTFYSFWPLSDGFAAGGGFIPAYGFENGGDTVLIERPARMERSTGGQNDWCRYSCNNGARCTVKHAMFNGIGMQANGLDNFNRPAEWFDFSDVSMKAGTISGNDIAPLALSPSTVTSNITIEYLDLFGDSKGIIDLAGNGIKITHSVLRDTSAVTGNVLKNPLATVPDPPLLVEDTNFLRVGLAFGGTGQGSDSRFPTTFRRIWAVGRGRAAGGTGGLGLVWTGTTLDPRTLTPDDKNSGKFYLYDSIFFSFGGSAFSTDGRSVGQRTFAVNSIGAHSGNGNPAYSGGIGSGSAYNSLLTRNPDVGAKATTSLIGSVISLNGPAGIAGDSRRCQIAVCAPTPGTRRILGNLSYGNTGPAMRMLENTADTDAERNTLVDSTSGSPVVSFAPVDPDETTGDATCTGNSNLECGPTAPGGGRPAWFSAFPVPGGGPKTTLKDNLIGNAPASQSVIDKGGSYFTNDDLLSTYNYYWRGSGNGDKGTLSGAGTGELLNQADPFISASGRDYRPTTITAGSTGTNRMGASWAGPLVDPATLPAVYKMLIASGLKYDQRSGDIEPVNPELGTAADFLPGFTMTGKRVAFTFQSTPTLGSNSCANPTDNGEKCGKLLLRLYRSDGVVYPELNLPPKIVRVPVQGSGKTWSVSESAVALAFVGMADPGKLDIGIQIGTAEGPHDLWDWTAGYVIPRYTIPTQGGGGSRSKHPIHPGGRQF